MGFHRFILIMLVLVSSHFVFAEDNANSEIENYSIKVRLYRGSPEADSFTALFDLSKIVAMETAKGFIKRTLILRDDFHVGATYCLYIDKDLYDATEQLERIKGLVSSLSPEGQFLDYQVTHPSDCLTVK